jgi:hypothetical protein
MVTYKLTSDPNIILRKPDNAFISAPSSRTTVVNGKSVVLTYVSRDWQEYLDWVKAGNTPEPVLTTEEKKQGDKARLLNTLDALEIKFAHSLVDLVKILIQKGVLKTADLSSDMLQMYQKRQELIDQIKAL